MKILFLTSHLNTGGITSYLLSLTRGLSQNRHNVYVGSAGGNCQGLIEVCGGKHINLGFRTKSEIDPRIYLSLDDIKKYIIQEKIEIIHAQTRVMQVMGYFLSIFTGVPLITTCHGFFKPRFFRRIFPCWGRAVIAISKPVQEHLIKDFHVSQENIFVIPNGIDSDRFTPVTEALRQRQRNQWNITAPQVIGIIARLSDVKGIDVLLHAMNKVVAQCPDVLLLIVGEGPEESRLVTLVDRLKLQKNVRFESVVNQTAEILPVFDVFIMPSRQEGLGLSVMEAQACALPVIASKVGGLVDLIEDARTGYFVPPENVDALAQKIIEVLKNPQQAQEVGMAARAQVIKNFSLTQMVEATEKVYEQYFGR